MEDEKVLCLTAKDLKLDDRFQYNSSRDFKTYDLLHFSYDMFSLRDRKDCEDDLRFLQITPYVILQDRKTKQIMTYRHTECTAEERLHNMPSLGLASHINTKVGENFSLRRAIVETVLKDLHFKLGYEFNLAHAMDIDDQFTSGAVRSFYIHGNEVCRTHLVVSFFLLLDKDADIDVSKCDEITDVEWVDTEELHRRIVQDGHFIDPWGENVIFECMRGMQRKLLGE